MALRVLSHRMLTSVPTNAKMKIRCTFRRSAYWKIKPLGDMNRKSAISSDRTVESNPGHRPPNQPDTITGATKRNKGRSARRKGSSKARRKAARRTPDTAMTYCCFRVKEKIRVSRVAISSRFQGGRIPYEEVRNRIAKWGKRAGTT